MAASERLSGTVTFLFTDIEGSTSLLKQLGRERYAELLATQQDLLREQFAAHGGEEVDTQGDSFFVAFRSAPDAVAAAVAIQRALADHDWPGRAEVRVRIGIHTGEAAAARERYVGFSVHRAARIGAAAHGGQVLLSSTTRDLAEDDLPEGVLLRDLGLFRLKDVDRPERITQVAAEGLRAAFPPLQGADLVQERSGSRRRSLIAGALIGMIAAAVAVPVFALGGGSGGSEGLAGVGANAVGVVDGTSGKSARRFRSEKRRAGSRSGPARSGSRTLEAPSRASTRRRAPCGRRSRSGPARLGLRSGAAGALLLTLGTEALPALRQPCPLADRLTRDDEGLN